MEQRKRRKRNEVVVISDGVVDTDPDLIEIGSSHPDRGKGSRPDEDDLVVLDGKEQRSHTRSKGRRAKKRKSASPPTPPHIEPYYISSSGESEEDEDEREEREASEVGLYYCGPPEEGLEPDAQAAPPPVEEGFLSLRDLEDANTTGDDGLVGDGDGVEWRDCAICLSRPTGRDGAVVEGCYHSFCFVCIAHWAALNPACPLCKRRFDAILHDLRLMPGPAARLHFRRYGLADAATAAAVSLSPRASTANPNSGRPSASARPSGSSRTHDVAVGILQASSRKTAGEAGYGGPAAPDTDVDRRRRVYARRLRAAPPAPVATTEGCSLELACARRFPDTVTRDWESKLKPWVVRELQAVLEEDDVDLLAIMTRSFLDDYARQTLPLRRRVGATSTAASRRRASSSAHGGATSGAGDERAAQAAWEGLRARLEEFLVDDAATFVHELLCFAVSPCRDMSAYDSAVRYPISPA